MFATSGQSRGHVSSGLTRKTRLTRPFTPRVAELYPGNIEILAWKPAGR